MPQKSSSGCAATITRPTWSAAACATCCSAPQAQRLRRRHQRDAERDPAPLPQLPHHRPPLPPGAHLLRPEDHRDLHLPRQPARGRGRRRRRAAEARAATCSSAATTSSAPPRRTRAAATSPSTACSTTSRPSEVIDYVERPRRSRGARSCAPSAIPTSASARIRCASCARSSSPRARPHHRARDLPADDGAPRGDRQVRPAARLRGVLSPAARWRREALDGAAARDRLLDDPGARAGRGLKGDAEDEEAALRRARFWGYLGGARSLDRGRGRAVERAAAGRAVLPPLRDALDPDTNGVRDIGQLVAQVSRPPSTGCVRRGATADRAPDPAGPALHLPSKSRRRGPRPHSREFLDDALRLAEIVSDAETADTTLAGRPIVGEGTRRPARRTGGSPRSWARRRVRAAPSGSAVADMAARPGRRLRRRRGPWWRRLRRRWLGGPSGPPPSVAPPAPPPVPTDLGSLAAAARSLVAPPRPMFLGTGAFGGPWHSRTD